MAWGAILGAASSYLGGDAAARENSKQKRANERYRKAFQLLSKQDVRDERANEQRLGEMTKQGFGYYDQLANALASPERGAAGQRSAMESETSLQDALRPAIARTQPNLRAGAGVAGNAGGNWANLSWARQAPRLGAQRAAINQAGNQYGITNYDTNAYNTLGDQQVDLSRQRTEANRRLDFMRQYRDKLLSQAANRFQYQGPSSSFYNAQLAAQGLQLGGNALDAYAARPQSTTQPTNQRMGPAY